MLLQKKMVFVILTASIMYMLYHFILATATTAIPIATAELPLKERIEKKVTVIIKVHKRHDVAVRAANSVYSLYVSFFGSLSYLFFFQISKFTNYIC